MVVNISYVDLWSIAHITVGITIGYFLSRHLTYVRQAAIVLIFIVCGWELFEQYQLLDWAQSASMNGSVIEHFYAEGESLKNSVMDVLLTFLSGFISFLLFVKRSSKYD